MPTAVQQMVRKLRVQALAAETDRALLEAFAHVGDEEAFAEVVCRHGPLVLGVCRRILGNVQDAEDAFQATFLVLARKSGSVAWTESVKNWLHGVACRIAMKARAQAHRRKQRDLSGAAQRPISTTPADAWNELRPILDQELEQLPPRYRQVLILCYLEGKTRDEAAELLGWSLGSVKGCLERGRELLRTRLGKRGLALSAALAAGLLAESSAHAVAPALQAATVHVAFEFAMPSAALSGPAACLAQGALNAMLLAKIKTVGFALMLILATTGTVWGVAQMDGNDASISVAQVARGQEAAREQRKDGEKRSGDFFGLIKAVDLKVGTLTVASLKDGDRNDVTFNLERKDLKIESTLGQPLRLSDLTPGLRVHLQLKGDDVTAMKVENPSVPAFITGIDPEKRIITARAERMNAEYSVAQDAKFTINGQAVRLMQVPLEQRVFLTLTFDKKTVHAIVGNKIARGGERPAPEGKDRPAGERPGLEKGKDRPGNARAGDFSNGLVDVTIIEADVTKNSLKLLVGEFGNELSIQNVTFTKDLKIKVSFAGQMIREVPVSQLAAPLQAQVQFDKDKKSISALTVMPPTVRGSVKSIDAAAKKITLTISEREEKTFDLDADATVRIAGREADKLAVVQTGMKVLLCLSPDRQRVIGITMGR